jgi:formylmethanofuran--tetrahydromethanopterin N-formyltransferase
MNKAMHDGIHAACSVDGVTRISAGNYGGNLGKFIINLKEVI